MSEPLHARLSPSAASRWTVCTSSVKFIEENAGILPPNGGVYADEGTTAHSWAAKLLNNEIRILPDGLPAEMLIAVRDYVEFVRSKVGPDDRLLVEKRVRLFYNPDQKGTTDAAIIGSRGIYICDLKYGAGVGVYAKNNKQLAIYAESLIRDLELVDDVPDKTLVTLAIYQPRDRNDPNAVRLWSISRGELREFVQPIEAAKKAIEAGETQFVCDPNEQCYFCPAKGICKAYAGYGLSAISDEPVDVVLAPTTSALELPNPNLLTREQRQKVLLVKNGLAAWMEAIEDQEITELKNGAPALQFKLVAGKTNRQWVDEEAAKKLLRNYLTAEETNPPSSLISPGAAEKLLKGKETSTKFENRFAELITKPEGKPTLVPIDDKRPALQFNPAEGLTSLDVI